MLLLFLPFQASTAVIFSEDFSDNSAGWSFNGPGLSEWEIAPAAVSMGHVRGFADPGVDHTATADNGVAGVNIGGNAPTGVRTFDFLVSPVIDTSTAAGLLTFEHYRWLNSDVLPYMGNKIEVYDGATSVSVFATGHFPSVTDSRWVHKTFDITAHKNATMRIRFGFAIGSPGVFTVSGWNVDDVLVHDGLAAPPLPAPAPFWIRRWRHWSMPCGNDLSGCVGSTADRFPDSRCRSLI